MALHLALYCFSTPTSIPSKRAPISSLPPYPQYQNWRPYAIYRLEHWGLQYVNNAEVTDDEILAANGAYGGLAELAVLVLPPQQLAAIARKLDLAPAAQTNASHPHQQVSFLSPTKHKSDAAVRSSEIR